MTRLTTYGYELDLFTDIYCKLEHLEDIEEELGCPLEVMFKVLKQKFVYNIENEKIELLLVFLSNKSNDLYLYGFTEITTQDVRLSLKDYGKTWALTKEELEND